MADDPRDDEPDDGRSQDGPSGGIPDDLSELTPEDIPDDLSELDLPGFSPGPGDPPQRPAADDLERPAADGPEPPPGDDLERPAADRLERPAADVPPPDGGPVDQRSAWVRLVERYVAIRVATMDRDGGPGSVLRWSARAPLASTLVLAALVATVLVITFGVPPISPLFLIPVVCGPVYPWLRLESRAQRSWHDDREP